MNTPGRMERLQSVADERRVKLLDAEIRCYHLKDGVLSYEVFLLLEGGRAWTSGAVEDWAQALAAARRETARHGRCMFVQNRPLTIPANDGGFGQQHPRGG